MRAPQIIMIVLITMNVSVYLVRHGKPVEGNYNFFTNLVSKALLVALLWWGGFFG